MGKRNLEDVREKVAWATVRHSVEGFDYIDLMTISYSCIDSMFKACEVERQCGVNWTKDNIRGQTIEVIIRLKK